MNSTLPHINNTIAKKTNPKTGWRKFIILSALTVLFLTHCSQNKPRLSDMKDDMDRIQQRMEMLRKSQEEERKKRETVLGQIKNVVETESPAASEKPKSNGKAALAAQPGFREIQSVPLESLLAPTANVPAPYTFSVNTPTAPITSPTPQTPSVGASDADELFKNAYANYNNGEYTRSADGFLLAYRMAARPELKAQCLYWVGESYYRNKDWKKTIQTFAQLEKEYPTHPILPSALLKKGYAYLQDKDTIQGKQTLQTLVEKFPLSEEAPLARERLREIGAP